MLTKTNKKRILLILTIFFLILGNIYIYLNREDGYTYFPFTAYSKIYVTDSTLYLTNVFFKKDSLKLSFSLPLSTAPYDFFIDSGKQAALLASNNHITIPLQKNVHDYILVPTDGKGRLIQIKADQDFNLFKSNPSPVNELLFCNIPGPDISVSTLNIWKQGKDNFDTKDIEHAIAILKKHTRIFSCTSDSAKALELGKFCASICNKPGGMTWAQMAKMTAAQQLDTAMQCKGQFLCGSYALMFHYLATACDLPNRVITFRNPNYGTWRYGQHYFNEVYLRDVQQWALYDGTAKNILPYNSNTGKYINAVDVKKIVEMNSFENKYTHTIIKDTLAIVPYNDIKDTYVYYFRTNANISFILPASEKKNTLINRIISFYLFKPDYYFYSEVNGNNWPKIIIRTAAFYLFFISLLLFIYFELRQLIRKYLKKHTNVA